jgi:IMP dehydrogenase
MLKIRKSLSLDDVLLVPKYSDIKSRSEVDVSVTIGDFKFSHPVIPANMKTICGKDMAKAVIDSGGLAILHRFMPLEEQIQTVLDLRDDNSLNHLAISVGVKEEDKNNLVQFLNVGVKIFCIDIAHGDSLHCIEMIKFIKKSSPHALVIAGNVATADGAERLWKAGAQVVKAGIGGGSLCSTRVETGNGVCTLDTIHQIYERKIHIEQEENNESYPHEEEFHLYLIVDGGLKNAGDLVKSLCFADMAMMGNVFSGSTETPGEIMTIDGVMHKSYVGSSTHKGNHVEGVKAIVPIKGSYNEILTGLMEGLKSGCSYQGVRNLYDLKQNPEFIEISSSGIRESHPHDVRIIK